MSVIVRFFDRCGLDRAPDAQSVGAAVALRQDTLYLDERPIARRIEPVLLGDVHWEALDDWATTFKKNTASPSPLRYTDLEVEFMR